jgi:hypothetical protein
MKVHFTKTLFTLIAASGLLTLPAAQAQTSTPGNSQVCNAATAPPDTSTYGRSILLHVFTPGGAVRPVRAKALADAPLVSAKTFNKYAAQRQAFYLSGTSDLSLYENFAIANVSDGTLQIGHNFTIKRENELVKALITGALQTNIANNFANVFSKKSFDNDIGAQVKFTVLNPFTVPWNTKLTFWPAQRTALNRKRELRFERLRATVRENIRLRAQAFPLAPCGSALPGYCDSVPATDTVRLRFCYQRQTYDSTRTGYYKEQSQKNVDDFYASELETLGTPGTYFNRFSTHWLSGQVFIPITSQLYTVAPDTSRKAVFSEHRAHNWALALNYGVVLEYKPGTFFLNARYRYFNNNSIQSKSQTITKYNQYVFTPTTLSPDAETVYVGPYSSFQTSSVQLQGVFMFSFANSDSKVGISALADVNRGPYDALNLTAGIPVFLKGQEKEKGVNVELQFKWVDWNGTVNPTKTRADKFAMGLSVSLPFGSIAK